MCSTGEQRQLARHPDMGFATVEGGDSGLSYLGGARGHRRRLHAFGHTADNKARADNRQLNMAAVQAVLHALEETVEAGLRRTVDIVGAAHAGTCDRGKGHDAARDLVAHRQFAGGDVGLHARDNLCENRRLSREVGVNDRRRSLPGLFTLLLIAEDAERDNHRVDGTVLPGVLKERAVCGDVIGIKVDAVHRDGTRIDEATGNAVERLSTSCGERERIVIGQPRGDFSADFAGGTKNEYVSHTLENTFPLNLG